MKHLRRDYLKTTSVAKRMSWAATRTTTREEDIAYCLIGLFNVNMPLLYVEGQNAFRRLQEEIIRMSTDQTIFLHRLGKQSALKYQQHKLVKEEGSLLAKSPRNFESSRKFHRIEVQEQSFQLTNRELSISLPVYQVKGSRKEYIAVPACHQERDLAVVVGIRIKSVTPISDTWLRKISCFFRLPVVKPQSDVATFVRLNGLALVNRNDLGRAQMMRINILRDPINTNERTRYFQISESDAIVLGTEYWGGQLSALRSSKHRVFEVLRNSGSRRYDGIIRIPKWGCFTVQVDFDSSHYTANAQITVVHPKSVTSEDCKYNDRSWRPPPGTRHIIQADGSDRTNCITHFSVARPSILGVMYGSRILSTSLKWRIIVGREVLVLDVRYHRVRTFGKISRDIANDFIFRIRKRWVQGVTRNDILIFLFTTLVFGMVYKSVE